MTPSDPKSSQHILIVDDDESLQIMLGRMLTNEGYTVSHARNGQEAISLYRSRPSDLVITELTLGGRGSFETIMELASSASSREIHRHRPAGLDAAGLLPAHGQTSRRP